MPRYVSLATYRGKFVFLSRKDLEDATYETDVQRGIDRELRYDLQDFSCIVACSFGIDLLILIRIGILVIGRDVNFRLAPELATKVNLNA